MGKFSPAQMMLTLACGAPRLVGVVGAKLPNVQVFQISGLGPNADQTVPVAVAAAGVAKQWANAEWTNATEESGKLYEANLLNLDCNKALEKLNWKPLLDFEETSAWTGKWYNVYYNESKESAMKVTQEQVEEYSGFLKLFQ